MDKKDERDHKRPFGGKGHFHGKGKPFHKGGRPFHKDSKPFHKRKLEVGVEYVDKEMGTGIVRKIDEDGVTVAFGDVEKLFPRRKRTDFHREDREKKPFAPADPIKSKVFTFEVQPENPWLEQQKELEKKFGVRTGQQVEDETLGKGEVTRLTERGVYVTYEQTGEHVLYPTGLPHKLFAKGQKKEKKVAEPPKGAVRTYTVPEAAPRQPKKPVAARPAKETRRGNTRYIEVGEGNVVISPEYGKGAITDIGDGRFTVRFEDGTEKKYTYPIAFVNGDIEIVEPEK